jgi:hypothetical protein
MLFSSYLCQVDLKTKYFPVQVLTQVQITSPAKCCLDLFHLRNDLFQARTFHLHSQKDKQLSASPAGILPTLLASSCQIRSDGLFSRKDGDRSGSAVPDHGASGAGFDAAVPSARAGGTGSSCCRGSHNCRLTSERRLLLFNLLLYLIYFHLI